MKQRSWVLASVMGAITLTGCGGGGESGSVTSAGGAVAVQPVASPTPTPTPSPSPSPEPVATVAPQGGFVLSPTLDGQAAFHAGFDLTVGTETIPVTSERYTDWAGAFRFICGGNGKLAYDDPILFPNRPGMSHLHQPWGNVAFGASTVPENLTQNPQSNCNNTANSLNRSLYWQPALVNDQGEAVQPDLVVIYYKRKYTGSAGCTKDSGQFKGVCVGLPNQIRFIFGWDPVRPTAKVEGAAWFCTGTGGDGKKYSNLNDVFANGCRAGDTLTANTIAPDCWDGKYLDTPDHRSHMAWPSYGSWGYEKCPASHPYVIPQQENKAQWTVTQDMYYIDANGVAASRIKLSSDAMLPGSKPGETLHADYMEGWDWEAKQAWQKNCIEGRLSCSAGDLGNGRRLIGADKPSYGWKNPSPRVLISSIPK